MQLRHPPDVIAPDEAVNLVFVPERRRTTATRVFLALSTITL
jgi:hypothetical protein